jgi:hypothetical protein
VKHRFRRFIAELTYEGSFTDEERDELFEAMSSKFPIRDSSYGGMDLTKIAHAHPTGPHTIVKILSWSLSSLDVYATAFEELADRILEER